MSKKDRKMGKNSILIQYFLQGFFIGLVIGSVVATVAFIYYTFFK